MIRLILFTAIGFWLSRKAYQAYDVKKRQAMIKEIRSRAKEVLQDDGWKDEEIQLALEDILEDYEQ